MLRLEELRQSKSLGGSTFLAKNLSEKGYHCPS